MNTLDNKPPAAGTEPAPGISKRLRQFTIFGIMATSLASAIGSLAIAWHGATPLTDDAYYYIVTARNYAAGGIVTFDQLNPTNGFHPLWMGLLIAMDKVIGPDAGLDFQIFAIAVLEAVLFLLTVLAAGWFWRETERKNQPWSYGFLLLILFFISPFGTNFFTDGMESTIVLLFFVLAAGFFLTDRMIPLALALPFLFLARLDALVFVVFPILVFVWLSRPRRPGIAAAVGAPSAIAFVAYSLSNQLAFGHFMPISGVLKSSFPIPTPHFSFLLDGPLLMLQPGTATGSRIKFLLTPGLDHLALFTVAAVILLLWLRPPRPARDKISAFVVILVLLMANLLVFQKWDKCVEFWYLSLPLAVSFLALGALAGIWLSDRGRGARRLIPAATAAALAVLLLFQTGVAWAGWADNRQSRERRLYQPDSEAAGDNILRFIIHHTAPDDIFATTDAGYLSFWTRRRVINLDGLINNFEYQDYLRDGRLAEYLRLKGVRYLVVGWWSREQSYRLRRTERMYLFRINPAAVAGTDYPPTEFYLYSYLYHRFSDRIRLCPEQEVYRSKSARDGVAKTVLVIYDLQRPCGK